MEELTYFLDRFTANPILNAIDILLVTATIFLILMVIRGTRAVQLLRGVIVVVAILGLFSLTVSTLTASRWLISSVFPALLIAVPIIFQPELRRALERLGRASRYFRLFRQNQDDRVISSVTSACQRLARNKVGALIVIEQETGLQEFIDTGIVLNADPSPELLLTIFDKHTELHDGAVIIRHDKLAAAACVLPLSTRSLSDRQMGLRHRAALGISEVSDAVIVVVSEETGGVSIAHNGRILRRQDPARLENILQAFLESRPGVLPAE